MDAQLVVQDRLHPDLDELLKEAGVSAALRVARNWISIAIDYIILFVILHYTFSFYDHFQEPWAYIIASNPVEFWIVIIILTASLIYRVLNGSEWVSDEFYRKVMTALALSHLFRFLVFTAWTRCYLNSLVFDADAPNSTVEVLHYIEQGSNINIVSISWYISLIYLVMLVKLQSKYARVSMLHPIVGRLLDIHAQVSDEDSSRNFIRLENREIARRMQLILKNNIIPIHLRKKFLNEFLSKSVEQVNNYMCMGISVSTFAMIYSILVPLFVSSIEYFELDGDTDSVAPLLEYGTLTILFFMAYDNHRKKQRGISNELIIVNLAVLMIRRALNMRHLLYALIGCSDFMLHISDLDRGTYVDKYGPGPQVPQIVGIISIYHTKVVMVRAAELVLIAHSLYTYLSIWWYAEEDIHIAEVNGEED